MNNGDQPIVPTLMQRVGEKEFRLNKAGDPKEHNWTCTGLTKREYFAGLAMQGIVSSIDSEENYQRLRSLAQEKGMTVSQWIARESAKQAGALLTELDKPTTNE